jgi:integrase
VASLVKVPTPRKRKVRPWSVDEVRRFLERAKADDDPLYAAWVLVLVLGLRRGEVLGLSWKSIDFETGELYVGEQLQRAGRQLLRRETKTEDSEDYLPLPAVCLAALRLRKLQQDRAKQVAGDAWQDPQDLVFTTRFGTPIEPGNLTRMFPTRSRRAGLREIRFHDTRHTCGSLLAALDVHPRVAMKILRHSQISITMEIYTHVTDGQTREALRKLGDALG